MRLLFSQQLGDTSSPPVCICPHDLRWHSCKPDASNDCVADNAVRESRGHLAQQAIEELVQRRLGHVERLAASTLLCRVHHSALAERIRAYVLPKLCRRRQVPRGAAVGEQVREGRGVRPVVAGHCATPTTFMPALRPTVHMRPELGLNPNWSLNTNWSPSPSQKKKHLSTSRTARPSEHAVIMSGERERVVRTVELEYDPDATVLGVRQQPIDVRQRVGRLRTCSRDRSPLCQVSCR